MKYFYETIHEELVCTSFRMLFGETYIGKARTKQDAWNLLRPYVENGDRRHWTADYVRGVLDAVFRGAA